MSETNQQHPEAEALSSIATRVAEAARRVEESQQELDEATGSIDDRHQALINYNLARRST